MLIAIELSITGVGEYLKPQSVRRFLRLSGPSQDQKVIMQYAERPKCVKQSGVSYQCLTKQDLIKILDS
jgi:hypothetical protein